MTTIPPRTAVPEFMIDLHALTIDPTVLRLISKRAALELNVLPIAQNHDVIVLVVPAMFHKQVLADVRALLGGTLKIKPIPAPRESIVEAIHYFYGASDS